MTTGAAFYSFCEMLQTVKYVDITVAFKATVRVSFGLSVRSRLIGRNEVMKWIIHSLIILTILYKFSICISWICKEFCGSSVNIRSEGAKVLVHRCKRTEMVSTLHNNNDHERLVRITLRKIYFTYWSPQIGHQGLRFWIDKQRFSPDFLDGPKIGQCNEIFSDFNFRLSERRGLWKEWVVWGSVNCCAWVPVFYHLKGD